MACVRKWRGKWVVDWRDPSGKRFIETVDGDRDAAKRRLGEILKSGEQAASKKVTFKDYAERWLENYAKGAIKQSTYLEYERALKVHLYPPLWIQAACESEPENGAGNDCGKAEREALPIDNPKHSGADASTL